ncbi:MAG: TolB family protein [Segetibacter sp.]
MVYKFFSIIMSIIAVVTAAGQKSAVTKTSEMVAGKNVTVKRVSTNRVIHRFFDTSPLSPSGQFLALFRLPYENKSPKPGDAGDVILVDIKTGKERVVAQSRGWEVQLGANVQWGKSDNELLFNDVDTATWKAFCVVLNPFTGKTRRLDGTIFMASNDGKKIASYNLIKSTYAQVGYGVVIPKKLIERNIGPVDNDGIYITDIATGKSKRIVTIKEIYDKSIPSIAIANPMDYEYYCFQVKWNPQGTRLLTTVQWSPIKGGARLRSVITMRPDGSDIRTAITPEEWAKGGHHINWMPDGEHLSMNLNIDGKEGLELISVKYDGTDLKTVFTPGSGHPSFHPKGLPLIVTDAYPNEPITKRNGTVPIRLLHTDTGKEEEIAEVFVSNTDGEFRIDPHPAWDRSGRYVIFNGFTGNTRNVFIADLKKIVDAAGKGKEKSVKNKMQN